MELNLDIVLVVSTKRSVTASTVYGAVYSSSSDDKNDCAFSLNSMVSDIYDANTTDPCEDYAKDKARPRSSVSRCALAFVRLALLSMRNETIFITEVDVPDETA